MKKDFNGFKRNDSKRTNMQSTPQIGRKKNRLKITMARGFIIFIIFSLQAIMVCLITLIFLNHAAIGTILGKTIPSAIARFPMDWLIAGAIGSGLTFTTFGIYFRLRRYINKTNSDK